MLKRLLYQTSPVREDAEGRELVDASHIRLSVRVEEYLRQTTPLKSHTWRAKQYDLHHFLLWLVGQVGEKVELADITPALIRLYLDERREDAAASTCSRSFYSLRAWLKWEVEQDQLKRNPTKGMKAPALPEAAYKGLSDAQIEGLQVTCKLYGRNLFERARNRLAIELMLNTGLRIAEVCNIRRRQWCPEKRTILDVKRKGGYHDDIYINDYLLPLMEECLRLSGEEIAERDPYANDEFPLIVSPRGSRVGQPKSYKQTPSSMRRMVTSAMLSAGIPRELAHPHTLRHTFAHKLLAASNDLPLVAKAMGHRSIQTTMRYTQPDNSRLEKAMNNLHKLAGVASEEEE